MTAAVQTETFAKQTKRQTDKLILLQDTVCAFISISFEEFVENLKEFPPNVSLISFSSDDRKEADRSRLALGCFRFHFSDQG